MLQQEPPQALLGGGLVTRLITLVFDVKILLTSVSLNGNSSTRMPIRSAILFSTFCMSLYFPSLWLTCTGCHTASKRARVSLARSLQPQVHAGSSVSAATCTR